MGGLCGSHNPISIKTILPVDRRECSLGSETVELTIYVAWRSTRCLEMVEWAGYGAWRTIYDPDTHDTITVSPDLSWSWAVANWSILSHGTWADVDVILLM